MTNAEEIRRLSRKRKELNKKRQALNKRKKGVDKALAQTEDVKETKFNKTFSEAVSDLKKGLKPLSGSIDASLVSDSKIEEPLTDESYRLGREVNDYQSQIDDLDYRINNLQIEEG